ncbi:MAG: T9SS type A sorting domain-containing protein [bacterium]|nr:T9SS type A sorting domain-containing protein [bacterium]
MQRLKNLIITFFLLIITGDSWAAGIGIYPEIIDVKCGQPFTIGIVVKDVADLMGARISVDFDSSSLRLGTLGTYATGGLLAADNAYAPLLTTPAQTGIELCTARFASSGDTGVSGNGTITTLCFIPIKSGSTTISIGDVDLRNSQNQSSVSISKTDAKILVANIPIDSNAVADILIEPNPYEADKHSDGCITFSGLETGGTLQIYTLSGELVERLNAEGTPVKWYVRDIASGVYFCVISDKDRRIVKKVGVIK